MKLNYFVSAKSILFAVLFSVMSLTFSSCFGDDDDDDSGSNSLVGHWTGFDPDDGEVEFYLELNSDGSASYEDLESSSYSIYGYWTSNENTLTVYSDDDDDDEGWYYRMKGDKLYLYYSRSDFDYDRPDYVCTKGDNPGNGGGEISDSSIIGTWSMSGYEEGVGYYESSLTFNKNGKCVIKETSTEDSEGNYTVTVSYSVSGDLSKSAILKLWGKTVDGDNYRVSYAAKISGNKLILDGLSGEAEGDHLVLTKK